MSMPFSFGRPAAALALSLTALLAAPRALAGDPLIAPGQQAANQPPDPSASAAPSAAPAATPPPAATASAAAPAMTAPAAPPPPAATAPAVPATLYPVHPWEMEPIDVSVAGEKPALREEQKIGAYRQPRWTARRRFPTTRVYVVPAGKIEFEWWLRYTAPFEHPATEREIRSQWELEMGLGHRLQLDLYLVGQQEGTAGRDGGGQFAITREKAEVRWALANWGEIWGNPTLYLEYQHKNDAPDTLEGKILLGGELLPRWHAGFNLQWERELWGTEADEYQLTTGVSYTVVDEAFHAGIEGYVELVDEKGSYWDFKEQSYLFGPSLMLSPVRPANILLAPLFGVGVADGKARGIFQAYIISGWTF